MRIIIRGFKCHLNLDLIFNDGQMTLVKGPSGVGKSSIIQAILWCLYGNMRNIYNNTKVTKDLSVTLEMAGMVIFRKKNPELLTVSYSSSSIYDGSSASINDGSSASINDGSSASIYEDSVAQGIIDNLWGTREVWKACSYIEQQSRCSLLSGSAAERLDMLNSLSFTGDHPQSYLKAISEQLKLTTQEFTQRQASLNTEIELYSQQLSQRPVQLASQQYSLHILEKEVEDLEKQRNELYQKVLDAQKQQGKLDYLIREINKTSLELERVEGQKFHPPSPLKLCEEDVKIPDHLYVAEKKPTTEKFDYSKYAKQKEECLSKIQQAERDKGSFENRLSILRPQLEAQQEIIVSIPNAQELVNDTVTDEQIWTIQKCERDRQRYETACQKLEISYSEEALAQYIKELNHQIDHMTALKGQVDTYQKLVKIQKEIEKFKNDKSESNDNKDEVEELIKQQEEAVAELKRGLEVLSCPECQAPLRYQNNNLEKADIKPVTNGQVREAQTQLSQSQKIYQDLVQLEKLQNNAELLEQNLTHTKEEIESYLEDNNLPELQKRLSEAKKIAFLAPVETSSEDLINIQKFQKWYYEVLELEDKLENIPDVTGDKELLTKLDSDFQKAEADRKLLENYQGREQKRMGELKRLEDKKRYLEKKNEEARKKFQRAEHLYHQQITEQSHAVERLESQLEEMQHQQSELIVDTGADGEYQKVTQELEGVKKKIQEVQYGDQMVSKEAELEEKRESLLGVYNDLETLTRLKQKAVQTECQQLEDTAANINTVLEQTLPVFFTDPIELRFSLYKKLKSKKDQIKPGLNLEIHYKGCTYDDVKQLSGGEGDRVSLAVMLALNSVSNSPLLLLDECVASLDSELKESCIAAIKAIPNKTVICVDHDDTLEGFYESVVSL